MWIPAQVGMIIEKSYKKGAVVKITAPFSIY